MVAFHRLLWRRSAGSLSSAVPSASSPFILRCPRGAFAAVRIGVYPLIGRHLIQADECRRCAWNRCPGHVLRGSPPSTSASRREGHPSPCFRFASRFHLAVWCLHVCGLFGMSIGPCMISDALQQGRPHCPRGACQPNARTVCGPRVLSGGAVSLFYSRRCGCGKPLRTQPKCAESQHISAPGRQSECVYTGAESGAGRLVHFL